MADTKAPPAPPDTPAPPEVRPNARADGPARASDDWDRLPLPPDPATTPKPKAARTRGIPAAPLATSGASGLAMALTGAYQAGGTATLAFAGATAAAGTVLAVVRRRSTVRKRSTARQQAGIMPRPPAPTRPHGPWAPRRPPGGGPGRPVNTGPPSPRSTAVPTSSTPTLRNSRGGANRNSTKSGNGQDSGWGKKTAAAIARHGHDAGRFAARHGGRAARAAGRAGQRTGRAAGRALWRAARASGRWTAGAAKDGLLAAAVGAWKTLRHVSAHAGGRWALHTWRTARQLRRDKQAADAAAKAATPPTPPQRVPAATVRRPHHTVPTFGGSTMPAAGHHFLPGAMLMAQAAAHYEPRGMLEVGNDFARLPEALDFVRQAMRMSTDQANDRFPLDPAIKDAIALAERHVAAAVEATRQLEPAFRKLHAVDIHRIENPRQGEQMWDYSTNR